MSLPAELADRSIESFTDARPILSFDPRVVQYCDLLQFGYEDAATIVEAQGHPRSALENLWVHFSAVTWRDSGLNDPAKGFFVSDRELEHPLGDEPRKWVSASMPGIDLESLRGRSVIVVNVPLVLLGTYGLPQNAPEGILETATHELEHYVRHLEHGTQGIIDFLETKDRRAYTEFARSEEEMVSAIAESMALRNLGRNLVSAVFKEGAYEQALADNEMGSWEKDES